MCNSAEICAHLNNIYIWAYGTTMIVYYFWIIIVQDDENFLVVFKNCTRRGDKNKLGHNAISFKFLFMFYDDSVSSTST